MIKARASPGCELCKRERIMNREVTNVLPTETLARGERRQGSSSMCMDRIPAGVRRLVVTLRVEFFELPEDAERIR